MINNCSFSGYVQSISELKQRGERAFIRFCIGIPRRYKNKEGKRDYDFIDAVSFGAQAEFVDEYFNTGSPVCVTGEMKTDLYTDQTGKAKKSYSLVTNTIRFPPHEFQGSDQYSRDNNKYQPSPSNSAADDTFIEYDDDDDLPF